MNKKAALRADTKIYNKKFPEDWFNYSSRGSKKLRGNVVADYPVGAKGYILAEEKDFVFSIEENQFDFIVSDGDHLHAGEWAEQIFKILKPDSFMFFHDVNNPGYPNLMNYKILADKYNKPNFLFKESSRADEDCQRGTLMIINKK